MIIGVISDTHIPVQASKLPQAVLRAFEHVDLILHAGDIYKPYVLDDLESIAPVLAALGDDDYDFKDTISDKRVKEMHILELEGHVLWLVHVQPYHLKNNVAKNSRNPGNNSTPNIIIFGHEHFPMAKRVDNILYVNPGSPTFLRYHRGLGTVGILDIDSKKASARIIQL